MPGRLRWLGGVATAIVLATGLVGCGGKGASDDAFVTGSSSGARIAPAGALAYFAIDSSLTSPQWKQVGTLLSRFPDRTKLVTQLLQTWKSSTQTSFESDVRPALGDQIDVVVFAKQGSRIPDVVLLWQPKNANAFKRLIAKEPTPVGDYRGWKVIGQTQAAITSFETQAKAGPALFDDPTYKAATGALPADALAVAYANGSRLTAFATSSVPQAAATLGKQGRLDWAAADITATSEGLRLDATAKASGLKSVPSPKQATLLDKIPADALGVVWFDGDTFRAQTTALPKALRQGLGATGTTIPGLEEVERTYGKLGAAFAHESALYVRRGSGPIPEVTLVSLPDDPAGVNAALSKSIDVFAGALPQRITIGTVAAHMVDLGPVSLYYGADQGHFVVTTSRQAFADLDSGGAKLSDDATFKEATSQAGMPGATDGFLYVNLTSSIETLESFLQAGGSPLSPEVQNNLAPLHTGLAWITNDGSTGNVSVFVGIN